MYNFQKIVVTILLTIGCVLSCYAFQYNNVAYNHEKVPSSFNRLKNNANKYYNEGSVQKAIDLHLELIDSCAKLGYNEYIIDLYEYIGDFVASREDISLAEKIGHITSYCNSKYPVNLEAIKYSYWAQAYLLADVTDTAKLYYNTAIECCNKNKLWLVKANINIGFSFIYYCKGDKKKTLHYVRNAEKIEKEKLTPHTIDPPFNLYVMQGLIYSSMGYKEKAINSDLQIIKIIKEDNSISSSELADKYNSLAVQYDELGDYDNAIFYYRKAIKLAKKYNLDEFFGIYAPRLFIASSYEEQGQIKIARQEYNNLITKIEAKKNIPSNSYPILIQCYQNLTKTYLQDKMYDSTAHCLDRLYKLHKESNYRISVTYKYDSYYNINKKNYDKAIEYAKKSLDVTRSSENFNIQYQTALINENLTTINLAQKNYTKALSYCQQSLNVLAPSFSKEEAYQNPSFQQVFHKRGLILTVRNKLKVLEALYAQKDPQVTPQLILSTIKLGIEALEYKNKNFKSKSSQTYWLNQQAIPLFEKAIEIALHLYEGTAEEQYLNEAFMLSERSKSMMMMSALQEQNATSFGGIPKELIEQELELEREFKVIEKARQDAEMSEDAEEVRYQDSLLFVYHHQKNILLHRFEAEYPKYYKLKHVMHQTSIQEVQEALDAQTMLVEYFQGQERIYVFTLTKDTAFAYHFKHTKAYDVQLATFQNLVIDVKRANRDLNGTYRAFVKSSYDLYQLLLVNSLVPNKTRLMLIPDGQLAYLPFEVLLSKELASAANTTSEHIEFSNLPYLLRDYTTNYNYSAQLFLQQRAQRKQRKGCKILALAPSYSNKNAPEWRNPYERQLRRELPGLPGAVRELDFLKSLFRGDFLYNEAANETNFKKKAATFDILHLAVHGLVDENKPELSGLALEEDNSREEDNILYAYEIKQLDLEAQLVVLSACETGIGKYQRGEGVMSIGRGFMYAGVPSLMTTLWSVNDYSSSIIIKKFYENLQQGMPKDEALRQAKLHYLDHFNKVAAYPALWACFVQVGDYAPLNMASKHQPWYYLAIGLVVLLIGIIVFIKMRKK